MNTIIGWIIDKIVQFKTRRKLKQKIKRLKKKDPFTYKH
jgi:uncharacterized membrane protein YciS (DUF1049 family)